MSCFKPLKARIWLRSNGKKKLVFAEHSYPGSNWHELEEVRIPCGQCIGCRLDRSREWAIRCEHEAQMHTVNSFVTLTYDELHLPPNKSLVKKDLQKFFKRLRKKFGNESFRYFACGEYGTRTNRPHYHVILFGLGFVDKILYKVYRGNRYYNSATLHEVWPFGFAVIGDVTFEASAYVARYTCKKALRPEEEVVKERTIEYFSGVEDLREPEFLVMSRRPGIGKNFLKKYLTSIYNNDIIVARNGRIRQKPPRFYDGIFEDEFAHNASYGEKGIKELSILKELRRQRAMMHDSENTEERLAQRLEVQRLKGLKLVRGIEV